MILVVIVALILILMPIRSTQDFGGQFTMDVPLGKHYEDVSWCRPNGGLGCDAEYWDKNAGTEINDGEIVVYYYNNSLLVEGESNALEHSLNALNKSYLYKIHQNDGKRFVLSNDLGMTNVPPYLVGTANDDGSEVVFVGGNNLNDLKRYADSVKFL